MSRLKKKYEEEIKGSLTEKFKYKNPHQVPRLDKVIISMGIADAVKDKNVMQDCVKELALISGQKPVITKAKQSISNFKLREGQQIGAKVTLRRKRMYDFTDRFIHITCPRISDFRGLKKKGHMGTYSLGLSNQQMFTELNLDNVKRDQGMNITFVTSAETEEECLELLSQLGIPFKQ